MDLTMDLTMDLAMDLALCAGSVERHLLSAIPSWHCSQVKRTGDGRCDEMKWNEATDVDDWIENCSCDGWARQRSSRARCGRRRRTTWRATSSWQLRTRGWRRRWRCCSSSTPTSSSSAASPGPTSISSECPPPLPTSRQLSFTESLPRIPSHPPEPPPKAPPPEHLAGNLRKDPFMDLSMDPSTGPRKPLRMDPWNDLPEQVGKDPPQDPSEAFPRNWPKDVP